jgi:hypothetical protein
MTINLDQYTNTLSVTDTATNADLNVTTKGTGTVKVNNGGGQTFLVSSTVASPTNYVAVYGNTQSPEIRAEGSTSSLDLQFLSKSTGSHMFYTNGTSYLKQFQVAHTASAVNFVQVTGAATGVRSVISAQGSDTNTGLSFTAKGNARIAAFFNNNATSSFHFSVGVGGSTSAVNYLDASGSATGTGPALSAQGSDANIDIIFTPKGTTGNVRFGTHTGTADTAVSGYIEIKDSGGTIRKLAVIT